MSISIDNDVATVYNSVIMVVKPGSATVTLTTDDGGYTHSFMLTVLESDLPESSNNLSIDFAEVSSSGVNVEIINDNITFVTGQLYAASYDRETGRIIDVATKEVTVLAGDMLTETLELEVSDNCTVKVFVWDKSSLRPLSIPYDIL